MSLTTLSRERRGEGREGEGLRGDRRRGKEKRGEKRGVRGERTNTVKVKYR